MSDYLEQVFKGWLEDAQVTGWGRWMELSPNEVQVLLEHYWQSFVTRYNSNCKQGDGLADPSMNVMYTCAHCGESCLRLSSHYCTGTAA